MERPGYSTRDVLAGIERLQAVIGEGDGKRARWYIERAAWPARRTRTTDGDEWGEWASS
jgi:hypothetical protein